MTVEPELPATNPELVNTDPSQTKPEKVDQQEKKEIKLEPSKEDIRKLKADEQIAKAQEKLNKGLIKHSDLPKWLQEKTNSSEFSQEMPENVEEKVYKRVRDDLEFENLKKTIPANTNKEQYDKMNEVLNDPDYSHMNKSKRLKYAMHEAGIGLNKIEESALDRGIQIGRGALLGDSNVRFEEKLQTEFDKKEQGYMDSLPDFAKSKK